MPRTYKKAAAFREALQAGAFDHGLPVNPEDPFKSLLTAKAYQPGTLFHWLDLFWEDYQTGISRRGTERSSTTVNKGQLDYHTFAKWALEAGLADRQVADIKTNDLRPFLANFTRTPRTWRKFYSHLRQFWFFLVHDEDSNVYNNVVLKIPLVKYKAKPTPLLENFTMERLMFVLENYPRRGSLAHQELQKRFDLALISFMLVSGSRRSGCCSVRLSRINWAEGTMLYDDKGAIDLEMPLEPDLENALRSYMKMRKVSVGDEDILFRTADGKPLTPDTVRACFLRWSKWMGVKINPHQIRKYRGVQAYQATKDIEAVRQLMNHSTIEMTRQYLGVSAETRRKFIKDTSPLARLRNIA